MDHVSDATFSRSSSILRQLNVERLLNLPVQEIHDTNNNEVWPDHDSSSSCSMDIYTSKSEIDAIMHCLIGKLIVSCNLSKNQCEHVIKVISLVLNRFHVNYMMPKIQMIWSANSLEIDQEYWFMCEHGHSHGPRFGQPRFFDNFQCENGTFAPSIKKTSYFIKLSPIKILTVLLPKLAHHIVLPSDANHTVHDIRDSLYAKEAKSNEDSLTLTLFTDELPASKSSKLSIFPVYLMINELPVTIRQDNAMLTCIFVGYKKPQDCSEFFKPLVDELKELEETGLTWIMHGSRIPCHKKFKLIAIIADAPMRAYLRSVKQYNSKFPCDWCKIETVYEESANKFPLLESYVIQDLTRTKDEFLLYAQGFILEQAVSHSIKSITPFLYLNSFDLVWGFSVDIMHSVYLGVMKDIFKRGWFNVSMREKPYFLGTAGKLRIMDARMKKIRVTSEHVRPPRSLADFKDWKANEFASFLCYFIYPILDGILPFKYLVHVGQLAQAILMLQSVPVKNEDVLVAKYLMYDFVKNLENLYDRDFMTYNSHVILHLADSVARLGPASRISAFNSENEMGRLKRISRKYVDVPQGIMNLYKLKLSNQILSYQEDLQDHMNHDELDFLAIRRSPSISGKFTRLTTQNSELISFCHANEINTDQEFMVTSFIKISNIAYSTSTYDDDKKRCNSYIELNKKIYKIITIIKVHEIIIFEVHLITQNVSWSLDLETQHQNNNMKCSIPNIALATRLNDTRNYLKFKHEMTKLFVYSSEKIHVFIKPSLVLN